MIFSLHNHWSFVNMENLVLCLVLPLVMYEHGESRYLLCLIFGHPSLTIGDLG